MLSSKDIIQEKVQKCIFSFVYLSLIHVPKRKIDQMMFLALVPLTGVERALFWLFPVLH